MQTITLEEHYATEAFMEGPGRELKVQAEAARSRRRQDRGHGRRGYRCAGALADLSRR